MAKIKAVIESDNPESLSYMLVDKNFLLSEKDSLVRAAGLLRKKKKKTQCQQLIAFLEPTLNGKNLARLYHIKAELFLDECEFESAINCFNAVPVEFFSDIMYNNLGFSYSSLGNNDSALENYINAVTLNSSNFTALKGAGEMCIKLIKIEESIHFLKSAIKIRRSSEEAWISLGTAFSLKDDPVHSYECFLNAVNINPTSIARNGINTIEKLYGVI